MWNSDKPLWLPEGSVRAIIALGTLAGFFAGRVPVEILGVILAFYFAKGFSK